MIEAFITKYWDTRGIFKVFAEKTESKHRIKSIGKKSEVYKGEGRHWHRSLDSARARAEYLRQRKIRSIKQQLVKYERMKF